MNSPEYITVKKGRFENVLAVGMTGAALVGGLIGYEIGKCDSSKEPIPTSETPQERVLEEKQNAAEFQGWGADKDLGDLKRIEVIKDRGGKPALSFHYEKDIVIEPKK